MQILGPVFLLGIMGFYYFPSIKRKQFAFIYCIVLAIVAFSFQPHIGDDLYREYQNLEGIRQYGWSYFGMKGSQYYESTKFEGLYLTQLYYYIFAQLPIKNFLPAITTFIVYFLQFDMIEKVSWRYKLSRLEIFCLYAFVLCTRETYMIMSGIRNQLAFTIAGYLIFIDLVENRCHVKCFIGYIAMIFVHQSAVFILAFRALCLLKNGKVRIGLAAFLLIWSALLEAINNLLEKLPSLPIINSLIYKINIYTVNSGGNSSNIVLRTRYLIYMLAWIPIIIAVFITILRASKYKDDNAAINGTSIFWRKLRHGKLITKSYACEPSVCDIKDIGWFIIFNICFTIGSAMYYWIYLRSAMLLGIVGFIPSAILFYEWHQKEKGHTKRKTNYIVFLGVLCIIKLLIIMFYMNRNMNFSLLAF